MHRVRGWEFHSDPTRTYNELREMLSVEGFTDLPAVVSFDRQLMGHSDQGRRQVSVRFAGTSSAYAIDLQYQQRIDHPSEDGGASEVSMRASGSDPRMLWRLVQRVEPERAAEIRAQSTRDAERSQAAWRACDHYLETAFERAAREAERRASQPEHRDFKDR